MKLPQLLRIRWGVRAALVLGIAASVIANVLHARDNPVSQAIAAWPPLALLLTVELISRIPVHRGGLVAARLVATATIASIAAWVSYWHMVGVAVRYGEQGAAPYLIPVSVDGLIVVASICLVELNGRIRGLDAGAEPAVVVSTAGLATPSKTPSIAINEKRRRVRHHKLVRSVRVTHPKRCVTAVQDPIEDPRATHEIDLAVRAIKAGQPDLAQRRIAHLLRTSEATVRRALRRTGRSAATHQQDPDASVHIMANPAGTASA